ncbi:MAG: alpha/beta hydrolase [Xanthomonadales bacterium]|nr:alpha/beta hydrolase [Xanthomonadales bacterium]MCB1613640.1 alpha/beta hydrolase [Xanthomonadales bacterium]MCP5475528.1 alpha/beta hydrolase [Rhodanobacteraceae bacterium]
MKGFWLLIGCTVWAMAAAQPLPQVSSGRIERLDPIESDLIPSRPVDVWLPPGYPSAAPYAVLYMHDGQMLFDGAHTWNGQEWRADEVASELIRSGKTRPFIIVGVWNIPAMRHSELYPEKAFERLSVAKQAELYRIDRGDELLFGRPVDSDDYLRFLVTEVKPRIDARYAVDGSPANTVVMGSSMGGLISLYAVSEYPEVFGAAACLSTHWVGTLVGDDTEVQQAFFAYFDAQLPSPATHRIYFDHGDQTLDAWYPPLQQRADALMRRHGYDRSNWLTLYYPGTDHSENAWSARLQVPMQFLLPPR